MSKIFTISDTHFGHANILKYESNYRPFESVREMNRFMVDQWNNTVGIDDTVIHVGDFSFGTKEFMQQMIEVLNGNIILIKGNHDRMSNTKLQSLGFSSVYKKLCCGAFIFSHSPLPFKDIPENMINIHGHIHSKKIADIDTDKHWNVSAEMINFTPVELDISLLDCDECRGGI